MLQDFASLIYGPSSVEGSTFCRVALAPLDVVACQHTTLRVTAFVAEALPPPELDPVRMRVHVSLREVVQETLRGMHQHSLDLTQGRLPSFAVRPFPPHTWLHFLGFSSLAQQKGLLELLRQMKLTKYTRSMA